MEDTKRLLYVLVALHSPQEQQRTLTQSKLKFATNATPTSQANKSLLMLADVLTSSRSVTALSKYIAVIQNLGEILGFCFCENATIVASTNVRPECLW